MADESREPPPLFEEDLDSKELEHDDIFQSEKKVTSNQSQNERNEKPDNHTGAADIHDVPLDSPEEDEDIFPAVKEETESSRPNDVSSSELPSSADDLNKPVLFESPVVSESPPEPVSSWLHADSSNDAIKETKAPFSKPHDEEKTPFSKPHDEEKALFSKPYVEEKAPFSKPYYEETKVPFSKPHDEAPRVSVTESSTTYASANKPPFGFHAANKKEQPSNEQVEEASKYSIDITISGSKKVGDGMNAYIVYKICTKSTIPDFRRTEMEVYRRFSDFLGLREKLAEKHLHQGIIIPPPPEKSIIGMAKIKVSKEESGSMEFVEQRRAALERFLNRIAQHPVLQSDPNFVDFLEVEGDLPKATNTSALSGAGVLRLFTRVGDSIGKITYKMDETDQWFEEKTLQIEGLDLQFRKLHSSVETLVGSRRELAQSTGILAKSIASVGESEEQPSLAHALGQLALVEEELDKVHEVQADDDFYVLAEFVKDYVGILQSVKDVFHERIKLYKIWKDSEVTLAKKREVKVRMELAHKMDKIQEASREISEWEQNVDKSQQDFERISKTIRKEMKRFENQRCKDFRRIIIAYLESLLNHEQQIIRHWESFLPETKLIV